MKSVYKCDTEYCLVKKLPMAETARKNMLTYFRPEKPKAWDKKPTLWLDSFNLEDVMNQYEQAHPEFEFIGPVPIDFDSKAGAFGRCVVAWRRFQKQSGAWQKAKVRRYVPMLR